jgi:PAS domain S-box-containing protein
VAPVHENEVKFHTLADNICAAVFIFRDSRIIYVNPAAEAMVEYSKEELQGLEFWKVIHPDFRELVRHFGAARQRGERIPNRYEVKILTQTGRSRWVEFTAGLIEFEGAPAVLGTAFDITERKATEDALRESEEWFRTLVEHAPEAILLLDVDTGKFVDANENALKLTGMGKTDLLKLGPVDISPESQPDGRPSRAGATERIQQALRGEVPVFEWTHQSSDGTPIPCEIRLVRLPSVNRRLVRASITDITERIRAEKTVRELATFADESPSPILRIAGDGRILYANSASADCLAALGCRIGQRLPEPWCQKVSAILESRTRKEEEIDCAGKTLSVMFTPVPDAGYVNLYGRDVTQRKRAEERLRQSQKLEALGTLASGVAHEFDNLLSAISAYTELAKSTIPKEHQAVRDLEKVEQVAKQARGVTVALLTFSHRAAFPKSAVNLSRHLSEMGRLLGRLLPARIEIVEDLPSDDGLWIKADAGQLQQVLINLALNATDAMPDGGQLRISLKAEKELPDRPAGDVAQCESNDLAILSVEDTGCGMSEEVLSRVFEPFYTTKPRGQGTGLGMSLVHGIVKDLGGTIAVESQIERGTHVTIRLPCIVPPTDPLPEESPRPSGADRGRIILVVERNEHILSIITSTLRSRGFDVLPTRDMEQAIGAMQKREHLVGLVIIDLDRADEAGLVRLRALCEQHENLPIVILAGTLCINLKAYGFDDSHLLRKPFQMGQLTAVVDQLLSHADS